MTCRDIVTRALRMGGIIRLNGTPTASESEHGMVVLQGIYDGFFNDGLFGRLTDYNAVSDYTGIGGERIFADGATITLPDFTEDDEPFAEGTASVIVTDGQATNYIYSDGAWALASGLTLDDTAPLANRGADGLAALLATRLVETFGQPAGPMLQRRALQFRTGLMLKYGSSQNVAEGAYY